MSAVWNLASDPPGREGLFNVFDGKTVFSAYYDKAEFPGGVAHWDTEEGIEISRFPITHWCELPAPPPDSDAAVNAAIDREHEAVMRERYP